MALDKNIEVFVIYMTFLLIIAIHSANKAEIALLIDKKIQILANYLNFFNIFLEKKALMLPEATKSNKHIIKLQKY